MIVTEFQKFERKLAIILLCLIFIGSALAILGLNNKPIFFLGGIILGISFGIVLSLYLMEKQNKQSDKS